MKTTGKVLLSSIASIALSTSIAVGGTFALFTSESKVNIAITSGKVAVVANATDLTTYSMDVEQTEGTFENGGTASLVDNVLTLTNVTPGDKATFTINVKNESTISVKYRLTWNVAGDLADGLEILANDAALANVDWTNLAVGEDVDSIAVSVELPEEAGDEYQGKTANVSFLLEAVQANAADSYSSNLDDIKNNLAEGNASLVGDVTGTASSGGYNKAGFTVSAGQVLNGNGHTLTVNGANSTWDCAIYTNGGTIKNLTVGGAFRGIFTAGCSSDIVIDNVTIDNVCYTFNSDGANPNYSVIVTNSTLNGWTSYSGSYKSVSFTDCNFGAGTGGYKYAFCRPYSATTFTNCVFEEGYEFDATCATSVFVDCYVGDTLITRDNVVALLGDSAANVSFPVDVADNAALDTAISSGAVVVRLGSGNYVIPDSAQGKTLTIVGNGDTVIATQDDGSYEGCDYSLDGATVTFENITINTDSTTYTGYARLKATYNNCIINGTFTLYDNSVFNNCTFNVSGDVYNIWTWGAPKAEFNGCTFNSDGKAILLYGTADTNLTVNDCVFNDKGGLTDLKAAIEIGNDYGKSYTLTVNNTVVNGYEINDKGINTSSTLWANKNSMGTDKLNVVVDGVDVY